MLEEQKEWVEGRPARRRVAVGDQGATGATVRCHPAVDQGLQRENDLGIAVNKSWLALIWVDQELKKEMGF